MDPVRESCCCQQVILKPNKSWLTQVIEPQTIRQSVDITLIFQLGDDVRVFEGGIGGSNGFIGDIAYPHDAQRPGSLKRKTHRHVLNRCLSNRHSVVHIVSRDLATIRIRDLEALGQNIDKGGGHGAIKGAQSGANIRPLATSFGVAGRYPDVAATGVELYTERLRWGADGHVYEVSE